MQVSICGCGWLGRPLAHHLSARGHDIVATRRSEAGLAELSDTPFQPLRFQLGDPLDADRLAALFNSKLLILNIPPGRRDFSPEFYIRHMKVLLETAKRQGTENVIFVSTSAVYGEDTRVVFEYSSTNPQTASAIAHVQIERQVQALFGDKGCVLRLSGLVGDTRHPARSLSGKQNLSAPQRRVNLVHQTDVIAAITQIIDLKKYGHTFHLSASAHPHRGEYYPLMAKKLGLPPPTFEAANEDEPIGKALDCQFTLETLGLALMYPDPAMMV